MAKAEKSLASDITKIRKEESFGYFDKGYFRNVPDMKGYMYEFGCPKYGRIFLIIDTSNSKYTKDYYKKDNFYFLIYKYPSFQAYLNDFFLISSEIMDRVNSILDDEQENADIRAGGVPHGYKLNDAGEIVVDPIESIEVRKIYKLYTQYGSIRKIASELKTNFSHIRDVLHDYRYEKMKISIIPKSVLKKARQLMDSNRKNRTS